jgi:hypothetical protein
MTSGKEPYSGVDLIRRADAYPRALRAARLYFGGLAWLFASALIIGYLDLSVWFFLPKASVEAPRWVAHSKPSPRGHRPHRRRRRRSLPGHLILRRVPRPVR